MADTKTPAQALDHVVVVLFENRSLDNVLGRLYGPDDGKTFEGVLGKDLSNPIPEWAEHGADRKVVPYGSRHRHGLTRSPIRVSSCFHANTQLFNVIDAHNRFKIGGDIERALIEMIHFRAVPRTTMDYSFVTDYISDVHRREMRRQPTYEDARAHS